MKKKDISLWYKTIGKKGGIASAKNKTPEQRIMAARKAAKARWEKFSK